MKGIISKTIRQLKVTTSKVVPLATEMIPKEKPILKNSNGDIIELSRNNITRELKKFLEDSGMFFEYRTVETRRGRAEIAGVKVEVRAIKHSNYDGGALVRITEQDETSYANTNKVLDHFVKNGINVAKECMFVVENREEGCIYKAKA